MVIKAKYHILFACFDSLRPSQQFNSDLTGLNQYQDEDKMSCLRTKCSASSEGQALNPSASSQALYH